MGRKFWGESGSFPGFGKVIIKACNIKFGKDEESATTLNSEARGSTRMGVNCFYNSATKPTAPGALLLGRDLIAVSFSWCVNGEFRASNGELIKLGS